MADWHAVLQGILQTCHHVPVDKISAQQLLRLPWLQMAAIVSCRVDDAQDGQRSVIVNAGETVSSHEMLYLMDGEEGEHGNEAIPIRDLPAHPQGIGVLPL